MGTDKEPGEFIDVFIADPSICRLYLGISKLDPRDSRGAAQERSLSRA